MDRGHAGDRLGIEIVRTRQHVPQRVPWRAYDRLCGTSAVREAITKGTDFKTLEMQWQKASQPMKIRQRSSSIVMDGKGV